MDDDQIKRLSRLIITAFFFGLCTVVGFTVWASFQVKKLHYEDNRITDLLANVQLTPGPEGKEGLTIVGAQGATGPQGTKGDKGDKGDTANAGANGQTVIGQQGDQGEPGPQGEKGETGAAGKSIICRQTLTGQTECKFVGDTDWRPIEEF